MLSLHMTSSTCPLISSATKGTPSSTSPCQLRHGGCIIHSRATNGTSSQPQSKTRICFAQIRGGEALIAHFNSSRFLCNTDNFLPVELSPFRNGSTSLSVPWVLSRRVGRHLSTDFPAGAFPIGAASTSPSIVSSGRYEMLMLNRGIWDLSFDLHDSRHGGCDKGTRRTPATNRPRRLQAWRMWKGYDKGTPRTPTTNHPRRLHVGAPPAIDELLPHASFKWS